jgi:hypothetical protein
MQRPEEDLEEGTKPSLHRVAVTKVLAVLFGVSIFPAICQSAIQCLA